MQTAQTVILMSGGIDSTTVAAIYRSVDAQVTGLFVDYGQPSSQSEWQCARRIAGDYGIPIHKIEMGFRLASAKGEFFGRNALLILTAAGTSETRPLEIVLGIHALAEYYDTTPLFVRHMKRLLPGYFEDTVTLATPLLPYTKAEVIQFSREHGVRLELTYSCEYQNDPPCLRCPSCEDRNAILAS